MFSRIVYGARVSIEVGFGAVLVGTGLATILGIISGYFGGLFDLLFQRFIDAWIAFRPSSCSPVSLRSCPRKDECNEFHYHRRDRPRPDCGGRFDARRAQCRYWHP
jgi:hypothetical protein